MYKFYDCVHIRFLASLAMIHFCYTNFISAHRKTEYVIKIRIMPNGYKYVGMSVSLERISFMFLTHQFYHHKYYRFWSHSNC